LTISDSVVSIGESAFGLCRSLVTLEIPNGVTQIGARAFESCNSLEEVKISDSVNFIGDYAFEQCSGLRAVLINDLEAWCNIDFGANRSNPLYYAHNLYLNEALITELVIPEAITQIKNNTFEGGSEFVSITFSNSKVSIAKNAFDGLSKLTCIIFGGSMDDWKTVTKEVAWRDTGEFIVECTDGTLNKAGEVVEEKEIN